MARGKHKAAKRARDARNLATQVDEARTELEQERALLAKAHADLAAVEELRASLDVAAERDRAVAGELSRLQNEVGLLTGVAEEAEATHERLSRIWRGLNAVLINRLGGKREGLEHFYRVIGGGGILLDPGQYKLGTAAAERIQLARGQRHRLTHPEGGCSGSGRALTGYLRERWRTVFDEAFPPGNTTDSVGEQVLGGELRDRLAEADRVANAVAESHGSDVDLDALHAWHPLPWIDPGISADDHTSPAAVALGATPGTAEPASPAPTLAAGIPSPTAVLPASSRPAIANAGPQAVANAWSGPLGVSAAVVTASGRIPHPWSPGPRYPRPGDAVSVKHWYTATAMGSWSRVTDGPDPDPAAALAIGEVAVGMATAAPFWLPPGQTAGYVDSENLSDTDIADIRLPYPQVLVVFADPLRLPAATHTTANDDNLDHALAELDAAVLKLMRDKPQPSLWDAVNAVADTACLEDPPTLDEVITRRGAHVEAVLLLADSLGRLADVFAWCLAIPASCGGMLGRFIVRASRSRTAYAPQIANVAAVAAWADWHPPHQELQIPPDATAKERDRIVSSSAFRRLEERGGTGGVHVLNVKRTSAQRSTPAATGRTLPPHLRRGHWRRQHHGPRGQSVKRVRIAPVLVNASRGALAPTVYRLPDMTSPQPGHEPNPQTNATPSTA